VPKSHVLVVDDEELYRRALERILVRSGYAVTCARDAAEAMGVVTSQPVDLVLSDVKMPGVNGIELVRQVRDFDEDLPCIVITGYGTAENSVEALRAGAFWYLQKPFDQSNLDAVRRLVEQAIEHGRLKNENRMLQSQLRMRYRFENIVGQSAALRGVLDTVEKVADSPDPRRERHRQGAHRPLAPLQQPPLGADVRHGQLRSHSRGAPGVRALRPRARRVHQRDLPP
jgi:DNA-binding NtrC family response regulator